MTFLPLTCMVSIFGLLNAVPIFSLTASAVSSPMNRLWSRRRSRAISSLKWSPPTFTVWEMTGEPSESTAMSVVPPPMSAIRFPTGFVMSMPAPIAAATVASTMVTSRAPD